MSSMTTVEAQISADDQARCKEQDHVAKMQFVASIQEGHSWQTATAQAGLHIPRSPMSLADREDDENERVLSIPGMHHIDARREGDRVRQRPVRMGDQED